MLISKNEICFRRSRLFLIYRNNVAIEKVVKYGMSVFGWIILIPCFMAYLLHYYFTLNIKCDRQKPIAFMKAA